MIYCNQWRCKHNDPVNGECTQKDIWLEVWLNELPVCESFSDRFEDEEDDDM